MKKRRLISAAAALLAGVTLIITLTGCSKGPEEEEAKEIVSSLVEASLPLNEIYYGDGMKVEKNEDGAAAYYANVADDAPYLTEAELREGTLGVFTENYAENVIFKTFLEGFSSDDTSGVVYARYVENGDRLQMRLNFEQFIEHGKARTYDLDDIVILSSKKNEIKAVLHSYVEGKRDLDVEVTVRREERETGSEDASESGNAAQDGFVWRLDSPTY